MADLLLKKGDLNNNIFFDLVLDGNDIATDDSILTATMISIFTDGSKPYIGTALNGVILGNRYANINKLSEENIKLYEQGIKESLQWLITENIVDSNTVVTEKFGNRLNVEITQVIDEENTNNLKFSLDEQLEIIDGNTTGN